MQFGVKAGSLSKIDGDGSLDTVLEEVVFHVFPDCAGMRLDHYLVQAGTDYCRSEITRLIRSGAVLLNKERVKPGRRLRPGDRIILRPPAPILPRPRPREIDFTILYEDQALLVIDKPAGLVVHPAAGHDHDTLVNGLVYRYGDLPGNDPLRPGIVHRLDRDTSGVLVVAKTRSALTRLSAGFKNREVDKTYHAIVLRGPRQATGRLVAPIGRHPVKRQKMAIRETGGRYAATRWQVLASWPGFSLVQITIETGRTHQIRVHMASMGAPVAGDELYGGRIGEIGGVAVRRQLLHASTLSLNHPETGQIMTWTAPLPPDMEQVLARLGKPAG